MQDSGAPRAGVTVTAISSPAEANAEVAETSSAPANAYEPTPDAPRIKPSPKSDPVAIDRLQAVVLAGGPSSGNPLTKFDARASLKFGASYRLIDFPMANIINSGLKRAFVLTQFNSYTLNQHVQAAYPPEVFGFGSQGYARAPKPGVARDDRPSAPPISTRPNVRTDPGKIPTRRLDRRTRIASATGGNRQPSPESFFLRDACFPSRRRTRRARLDADRR